MRPASDLALDMGTATTRVLLRGDGVAVDDETIAARDIRKGDLVAIGVRARDLVESDNRYELVHPMVGGAVADQHMAQDYLTAVFKGLGRSVTGRTDVLATVSSGATAIERRAMRDVVKRAGAAHVQLIEKSVAAALGAGLPVHDPAVNLVVELGAGTAEVALIALGNVVASSSTRSGNAVVDELLRSALRHQYGMRITNVTAERMKLAIDGAGDDALVEARGVLLIDGSSTTAIFESSELTMHLGRQAEEVLQAVKACLVQITPEMASDVISSGMLLTGGPANSPSLVARLSSELALQVHVPSEPRHTAILGAGKCLEAMDSLSSLFVNQRA